MATAIPTPSRLFARAPALATAVACVAALGLGGCAGMSHHTRDTAIGAGVGAVAGSVLTGSTAGTVAGAVIGGAIGHENRKK
jgi:osmotically inducible lipoprotein OsmB